MQTLRHNRKEISDKATKEEEETILVGKKERKPKITEIVIPPLGALATGWSHLGLLLLHKKPTPLHLSWCIGQEAFIHFLILSIMASERKKKTERERERDRENEKRMTEGEKKEKYREYIRNLIQ